MLSDDGICTISELKHKKYPLLWLVESPISSAPVAVTVDYYYRFESDSDTTDEEER